MARPCTVCAHESRSEIDERLVAGEPFRKLSKRFGTSDTALFRHKEAHILPAVAKAQEAREQTEGGRLFEKIHQLEEDARRIGRAAEKDGDHRAAIAAVRELVRIVELLAKLTGELKPEAPVGGYVIVFESGAPRALPESRPPAIETTTIDKHSDAENAAEGASGS